MIWENWLRVDQIGELKEKKAIQLNDQMRKYAPGKAGAIQSLNLTRYVLGETQGYAIYLVGTKNNDDSDGFFYLKSLKEPPFMLNGRLMRGSFLYSGDQVVLEQDLMSFFKVGTENQSFHLSDEVIQSDVPILIEGETGTGKGHLAKKIFDRRLGVKKWVHLNLASLSPGLVESEIFGHVRGAFTGATSDNRGALKSADGGVLFLDEVDSLSKDLQTKLLTFLDDQTFCSVGSQKVQQVKIKLIIGSGRELEKVLSDGLMREDFYYRMASGFRIRLPTLKCKPELIEKFCENFSKENRVVMEPTLVEFYKGLPWPGNYRQLKIHLQLKKIVGPSSYFSFDEKDQSLIHPQLSTLNSIWEQWPSLEACKQNYAQWVWQNERGSHQKAAEVLQINIKTLKQLLVGKNVG